MSLFFRFIIVSVFLFILSIGISQDRSTAAKVQALLKEYQQADALFEKAENIPDETKQDELNRQVLASFKSLIPRVADLQNDSIVFSCYLKAGILEHYFGNFTDANLNYNHAIAFATKTASLKDSAFFPPLLYSGIIYYQQSLFDSALLRFKQAEEIDERYGSKLKESERLYNNLGVLHYEMGNYRQGKNYFGKAIAVLQPSNIYYKPLLVNYKINLAQALTKLEDYNAAYSIYQNIISYNFSHNEIYHNLGTIQLALGSPKEAIEFFRKVNYNETKIIKLYNDMAFAFYQLKQYDSSNFYLQKANEENSKRNGSRQNIAHGLTLKYEGDLLANGNYEQSLKYYQQAIVQFDKDFKDTSVDSQPEKFSGLFSYINLFDALTSKALAAENLFHSEEPYESGKNPKWLIVALNAYKSAFTLANYVQKTYETDEARLFLNRAKYKVHARPIDVAIELYNLTKDKKYLEQAYRFDQLNKASVLSLGLHEVAMEKQAGVSNDLLKQISDQKSLIAQLNLKATKTVDSSQLKLINEKVRDEEIKLARLQEKINSNSRYALLDPSEKIPTVSALQDLLDKRTMLLSFHLHENQLTCFYFTQKDFDYLRQKLDPNFFQQIDSFLLQLRSTNSGKKYSGANLGTELYKNLFKLMANQLKGITRLIIIPDDELNYLPFEALQNEKGNYLVEDFSIQYQYSTALLNLQPTKNSNNASVISFAPFAESGNNSFQALKFSKEEVETAHGKVLLSQQANKKKFLELANHYSVIHLATHASVNDSNPNQSFIAFYPDKKDSSDYKLYAREIYELKLDSTKLIILSACETGAGQLVRGEGLMSLSRAFAYSGCPNIITSLWKAEDKSTAFIAQRLHFYLDKDLSPAEALQRAKIDLLHSDQIDPSLKTPNYWAHLVFIGDYEKTDSSNKWWLIAGLIIIFLTVAIIIGKRSR